MTVTAQKFEPTNSFHPGVLTGMFDRLGGGETENDLRGQIDRVDEYLKDPLRTANDHHYDDRPQMVVNNEGLDTRLSHQQDAKIFRTVFDYNVGEIGGSGDDGHGHGDPDIATKLGYRKVTANQSGWDNRRTREEKKDLHFFAAMNAIDAQGQQLQDLLDRMENIREKIDELNEEILDRQEAEKFLDDDDINDNNVGGRMKRRQFVQHAKSAGLDAAEINKFVKEDGTIDVEAAREALKDHGQDQGQRLKEYKQEHQQLQEQYNEMKQGADSVIAERHNDPQALQKMEDMAQTDVGAGALVSSAAEAAASGEMTNTEEQEIYELAGLSCEAAENLAENNINDFIGLNMLDLDSATGLAMTQPPAAANEESSVLVGDDNNSLSQIDNITPLFADRAAETAAEIAQGNELQERVVDYTYASNSRAMSYGASPA